MSRQSSAPKEKAPVENSTAATPKPRSRKKVALVDTSHAVESRARDMADARMSASKAALAEKKGMAKAWGITKSVWTHNLWQPYFRQREIIKARKEILGSGNAYVGEADEDAYRATMDMTVRRFLSEHEDEVIHKDAGETREQIEDSAYKAKAAVLQDHLREAIVAYASSSRTEDDEQNFIDEKNRLLSTMTGVKESELNVRYADNLLEVAREVAREANGKLNHDAGVASLDLDLDIIIGKAKNGVRTEKDPGIIDRLTEKLAGRLPFINEATIALGYSAAALTSKRLASSKLAAWGTFGLSAALMGALAGSRERLLLKQERVQHLRDMAAGKGINPESARRHEMENYRYEMRGANELRDRLESILYTYNEVSGKREQKDITTEEGRAAVDALVEIESRIQLSDRHKIDLISYSKTEQVDDERFALDLLRAEVKRDFAAIFPVFFPGNKANFAPVLEGKIKDRIEELTSGDKGIEAKDRLFQKMSNRQVNKKVVNTILGSLVVGAAAQETLSFFQPKKLGFFEYLFGRNDHANAHRTPLAGSVEYLTSWIGGKLPGGSPDFETIELANSTIKAPQGIELNFDEATKTYELTQNDQSVLKGLKIDEDGAFTPESRKLLQDGGYFVNSQTSSTFIAEGPLMHTPPTAETPISTGPLSPREYLEHSEGDHRIHRQGWYDNNTAKFDKNEQKLWWGGTNYKGLDKQGNFVFTIDHMSENGSFHGKNHVNPFELAKEGKLKLLLSLSRDTQQTVFEVPIDEHGNAVVDPNSEIGRLFFKEQNGKAVFLGRFAEVAHVTGQAKDGAENVMILATEEGKGYSSERLIPGISGEAPTAETAGPPRFQSTELIKHTDTTIEVPASYEVDPPLLAPYYSRRSSLEPAGPSVVPERMLSPYYYAGSPETIKEYFGEKKLPLDPYRFSQDAEGKRIIVNKEGQPVKRDLVRERTRIETYLESQDKNYYQELETLSNALPEMSPRCRVSINIPARYEARNLRKLLDIYTKQKDWSLAPLDPSLYEINILVNRKESEPADDSVDIVNVWKREHPEFKVNVIDIAFLDTLAGVGRARKYVTDLALLRSNKRREADGPLYIESEDADLVGVDRQAVIQIIRQFDKKPELDVLRGLQDRQPEILQKNDLLFFSRRLWDFMEIEMRDQKYRPDVNSRADFTWNRVISGGWNTAFTAEAYAQIGGYDGDKKMGEDMDIGAKISVLRGSENESGRFVPNTHTAKPSGVRFSSSPRRFIWALARNVGPYDDFEDQTLKGLSLDQLLDRVRQYERADASLLNRYMQEINTAVQFLEERVPDLAMRQETMNTTLFNLGLKPEDHYVWDNGRILLKPEGLNRVAELLNTYRTEKRWQLGYRRQATA